MKKIFLIAVSIIALQAQAQKRVTQFSIAAEGAVMATEQAFTVYNPGFGGSAKLCLPTGKKDFATFSFGVINFSGRAGTAKDLFGELLGSAINSNPAFSSALETINLSHPPLTIYTPKIGYKHFLNNNINVEVEGGYCFATVKKLLTSIQGEIGGYDFSFGIGTMVSKKIDIGIRYEQFQSTASQRDFTSFLALRTLVNIDFK